MLPLPVLRRKNRCGFLRVKLRGWRRSWISRLGRNLKALIKLLGSQMGLIGRRRLRMVSPLKLALEELDYLILS